MYILIYIYIHIHIHIHYIVHDAAQGAEPDRGVAPAEADRDDASVGAKRVLLCRRKKSRNNCLHFSICACHPCAGAMLIFSVSFQC